MKEVLEYLFGRLRDVRPVTHQVGDETYAVKADGTLGAPVRPLAPQWTPPTLLLNTLGGMRDAILANLDGFPAAQVALHIVDPLTVELLSIQADAFGRRHVWARAQHVQETPFKFGSYYSNPEDFLIAFRSSFLFTEDAVNVQKVCSAVGSGDAVAVSDDGISQEILIKSGTVTKSSIALPAEGVPLVPWRTFREVDPVTSRFLLRMRGVKDGLPQIALFEIDARWRLDTQAAIIDWLKTNIGAVSIIA